MSTLKQLNNAIAKQIEKAKKLQDRNAELLSELQNHHDVFDLSPAELANFRTLDNFVQGK